MITVATFTNAITAQIAKGLLESEGIECQILNETIPQILPIGEIELQVPEQDVQKAQQILSRLEGDS